MTHTSAPAPASLTLTTERATARLTLNRPDKRNALDEAMWAAIPERLAEAEADPAVRLLIVEGAGGHFAAGADISEFEAVYATPERAARYSRLIAAALNRIAAFPHPVIARIEGACVGGGCALALSCDLRFAATGARFGITPAKLGLAYPFNDLKRLVDTVGLAPAKDLLYSARLIEADEALGMGLIDRLTTPGALDTEIDAYARRVLAGSPASHRTAKAMLNRIASGQGTEDTQTQKLFLDAFSSQDFTEGYRAFLEKRAPDFG